MRLHLEQLDWPDQDDPHRLAAFEKIADQTFEDRRILVDNRHFEKCRFENCNFVHSGGPFAFYECTVEGKAMLSPTGAAHRALRLHDALSGAFYAGMPPPVY